MDIRAWMGLQAIIQTIMMGKMEMVFPDMYMMNRFMGICFRGPRATIYILTFSTRFLSVSWMLVSGTGFSE
ncbi:hypothetical protein NQD34_013463 [Periophthalmus magnuspinnatus]|nr:hypothetical protein NQD34_013463 [Periophthalmus magnuspinnatus]